MLVVHSITLPECVSHLRWDAAALCVYTAALSVANISPRWFDDGLEIADPGLASYWTPCNITQYHITTNCYRVASVRNEMSNCITGIKRSFYSEKSCFQSVPKQVLKQFSNINSFAYISLSGLCIHDHYYYKVDFLLYITCDSSKWICFMLKYMCTRRGNKYIYNWSNLHTCSFYSEKSCT